jgi:hypothetical protein
MAHFAELDQNNIVVGVQSVANEALACNGVETQSLGIDLLEQITGHRRWVQTSYSGRIRGVYAGIGYTYDERLDAFVPPCPGDGWTLDEATGTWVEA